MRARLALPALLTLTLPWLACSAAGGDTEPGTNAGAGGADAGFDAIQPGGAGGGGALDATPSGDGSGPAVVGEVYAHSDTTLYKLEPISKAVTIVGAFDCLGSAGNAGMWDIAVDKDGLMLGSANGFSGGVLVRVNRQTAHCDIVATASSLPNSLAFVPAGTLDPAAEALVGFDRSKYVRIDKATGAVAEIGGLNPNNTGDSWESSGDIVSIIGGKTYATVKPLLGGTSYGTDTIVEIDPVTGRALAVLGNTGFYGLWGLGFWGGIAYGFSEGGELCEIDLATGKGVKIPISNLTGLSFWGAGVTTAAPLEMPK